MKHPNQPTTVAPFRSLGSVALLCGLAACDAPDASRATSPAAVSPAQLDELAISSARAKAVFVGEVIAIDQRVSQPDATGRVVPFRFVTWRVTRAVRGVDQGSTWTGRFAGGKLPDGRSLWVSEVPEFELGQRALLLADHGDAGSCALVGCRDGMVVLDDLDPPASARVLDDVLAVLDAGDQTRARSADPDAPFGFETSPRIGRRAPASARAASGERLERRPPAGVDRDPTELDALRSNGFNPVLR